MQCLHVVSTPSFYLVHFLLPTCSTRVLLNNFHVPTFVLGPNDTAKNLTKSLFLEVYILARETGNKQGIKEISKIIPGGGECAMESRADLLQKGKSVADGHA